MKNIRQIQLITRKLNHEKSKFSLELAKLNAYIEKKIAALNKMKSYRDEYNQDGVLTLSRSLPSLNQNIDKFIHKIHELINNEELEIASLAKSKSIMMTKIEAITNKINAMCEFEVKAKKSIENKLDKVEQMQIDDLVVNKQSRGLEYE